MNGESALKFQIVRPAPTPRGLETYPFSDFGTGRSPNGYCRIGVLERKDPSNQKSLGRAGSKRWLGKRPVVRGVVMNPVDHPHEGGEGRASIGREKPTTPWGYPALGKRSRKRNKYSYNLILRRRSK
ncbi:hypothetical protein R6Q57_029891 [Mikania cordata]